MFKDSKNKLGFYQKKLIHSFYHKQLANKL